MENTIANSESEKPTMPPTKKWPNTIILVHGYASPAIQGPAQNGKGNEDDFWYWQGRYSDNVESYNLPEELRQAAKKAGEDLTIKAANWDGKSRLEESAPYLIDVLNRHCTGLNTCDLIGHSTGDAPIGYVLDKFQDQRSWNIRHVFVAGGAGGGTEAADWPDPRNPFLSKDPVVLQLVPSVMRALYNHNMRGHYKDVPNIRFVGAGTKYDKANRLDYPSASWVIRGQSDGLVPFHSQGGVSEHVGSYINQAFDAYCIASHTSIPYSCGQLNLGDSPAKRWNYLFYSDVKLFDGFRIQMIDNGKLYNHTDEVGRLAQWIIDYLAPFPQIPPPFYSVPAPPGHEEPPFPTDASPCCVLSGKVLNVRGASTDDGAPIIQYDDVQGDRGNLWVLEAISTIVGAGTS